MANLLKELPEACRSDYKNAFEVFQGSNSNIIKIWKDHLFGPGFEPETVEYAFKHHEPKEKDILMISFSKSGSTWTREIVRQILYGRDEKLDLITQDLAIPQVYLESGAPTKYNILHNLPIPRNYYVTHLPAELVNVEKYKSRNMKFIYTLRNPKDRMASLFNFLGNFPMVGEFAQFDFKNWDVFFKQQTQGTYPTCMKKGESYMEHILSWLPHVQNNDNAMMIMYEDMIKNPQKEVKRIADLLEVQLSDEEILEICEKTSFETLKKSDAKAISAEPASRHATRMLRKGKIGDWRNYFTPEQSAFIEDEVEKKLKGTGIKFIYE